MITFLAVALAMSASLNIGFAVWHYIQSKNIQKKPLSTDARELLHHLTNGGGIVRVSVIDPDGLLLYRGPK
jgi:hypothetical protein